MSEQDGAAVHAAPVPGATAGSLLRAAREKSGLHIGALAVALKVPVSKLEALESDRLDLLPDAVFARALASSICRTIKVDPAPVLRLLPDQEIPRLQLDARVGPSSSFDKLGGGRRSPLLSRVSRPAVVVAAILVLGALGVAFLPSLDLAGLRSEGPAAVVAPDTGAVPAPVFATAPAALPEATPATTPATVAATAAPAVAALSGASALPAPVVANPVPAASAAAPRAAASQVAGMQSANAAPDASSVVVFKARGTSWVEVTDAAGVVQLRKTLASGESAGAAGSPPLSVVVGRVDATEVTVRGKPFDLSPFSKDNVARLRIP